MTTDDNNEKPKPQLEVVVARKGGAAASNERFAKLDPEHLQLVQVTIGQMISGFAPPEVPEKKNGMNLESVELEIGFELEAGVGHVWRLILVDGKATASTKATVSWKRG